MGRVFLSGAGGAGAGSDDCTAAASDVIAGKTAIVKGSSDEPVSGTLRLSGDAGAEYVLKGKTFYTTDPQKKLTGTMPEWTGDMGTVNAGAKALIPTGFHNGTSYFTSKDLASQTPANAAAENIIAGKTAWVGGKKVTGTMPDNSTRTSNGSVPGISSSYPNTPTRQGTNLQLTTDTDGKRQINIGVPKGYYPGPDNSYVNRPASDFGDAVAGKVLSGSTFTSQDGIKIKGTMPQKSGNLGTLDAGAKGSVPAGYHDGTSYFTAKDLASQTAADAVAGNILSGKTAWIGGKKVTGTMPNRGQYQSGGFGEANDYYAINNLPEGYYSTGSGAGWAPEARCSKETVRKYLGCDDPSKWLAETAIAGQNGTIVNRGSGVQANDCGVNDKGLYYHINKGYYQEGTSLPWVYIAKDKAAAALGVQSVVNFSVAQNAPLKLQASWAKPSKGPWSGIRLCAKLGSYPTGPDDSVWGDSADTYAIKTVSAGTWYVRAWNYVTWSGGRMYGSYAHGAVTIEDGSDISLGGLKLYLYYFMTSKYQGTSNRYNGVYFDAGDTANYALNNMMFFRVNGNPTIRLSNSTGLHAPQIVLTALKTDNPSYGSALVLAGQLETVLKNQGVSNITAYVAFENNVFKFTKFTNISSTTSGSGKYWHLELHFDNATQISGGSYGLESVSVKAPVRVYFKKS